MDYQQMFEYNRLVRRSFLDVLAELPWSEVVTDREASFYSLRNMFLHTLDVEELLIHHLLQSTLQNRIKHAFDDFNDIESIRTRTIETDRKTEIFLENLTPERLNKVIEFPSRIALHLFSPWKTCWYRISHSSYIIAVN